MNVYPNQFLGLDPVYTKMESAAVAVLLYPYEGGVSYGRGTAIAPEAVMNASNYLELYDEVIKAEPYRMGIATAIPATMPNEHQDMFDSVYRNTKSLLEQNKFVVLLGGDHSISSGYFKALNEKWDNLAAIQIDAHADLRDSYEGSPLSHACVMSRIREMTTQTRQFGIRSMCKEEADKIERDKISLCTMHDFRSGSFDINQALESLPENVFVTLDVDALDWSVISSTGTPEPGGFMWHEIIDLLGQIFSSKNVVGFDVVELSHADGDRNSPFAVAKLVYKMIGLKMAATIAKNKMTWPQNPKGPLFID